MRARPLQAFLFALLLGAVPGVLIAQPAPGDGPIKSGIRGRFVIAPELLERRTWPMDPERSKELRVSSRVQRPTGRGALGVRSEPMPELLVALEGARSRSTDEQPPRKLVLEGMRFVPGQILVARPGVLVVENRHSKPMTIRADEGDVNVSIEPGKSAEVPLTAGLHGLLVAEMPFARAQVRVLDKAVLVKVNDDGTVPPTAVEAGDYQLAFYHGVKALRVQELPIPDGAYVAFDAAASANAVVTVSIKKGDLEVAVPPRSVPRPAPPPPPPPPAPAPEPGSEG
jgi:hypothetical protein